MVIFYIITQSNPELIIVVNSITRMIIATIAGYTYYFLVFKKQKLFFIKYLVSLFLYPLFTFAILNLLIDVVIFNIVIAKFSLDVIYSLLMFILFNNRFSFETP